MTTSLPRAAGARTRDGNSTWRVDTPHGPVLQKRYAERGGVLHSWAREIGSRLLGRKTSTRAIGRCATERRLLALWRDAGLDVSLDVSDRHPHLAHARALVLEYLPGPSLAECLADGGLSAAERTALLGRFAEVWCARHRLALERDDPSFVQEHGSLTHVLVEGRRFVTLDLENAFRPWLAIEPLVYKEIAAYLRSLRRIQDEAGFQRDLRTLVAAYADRGRLAGAAEHYLANPDPLWRAVWGVDRWRDRRRGRFGKYLVLQALRDQLDTA